MPRALPIFQDPSSLDEIPVATPCPAEWADMVGSDTVRFCASCQKNVFNLSGMKREEALDLLRATEGRICVRFFRRADGTVLTEDCPVGIALVLRRAKRVTLAAAALSVGALAALLAVLGGAFTRNTCQRLDTIRTTIEDVSVPTVPTMGAPPPPSMGEATAPMVEVKGDAAPPQPREIKGKVAMPHNEIRGLVAMPKAGVR